MAEYYPRSEDPVLGVWAHRQAIAARDAGVEIQVLVLHRPLPPLAALAARDATAVRRAFRQPAGAELDGLKVGYINYLSPPRPWSYGSWGAWAAPALRLALKRLRRSFSFDLIHAHYAAPAGDAVLRAAPSTPLIVSVHGGDVLGPHAGSATVERSLRHARLVLANSAGTARRCELLGAHSTQVVHLGTDVPHAPSAQPQTPTLVTVGHLVARKRHADVLQAVAALPHVRYVIVGDGPERGRLQQLAAVLGIADRVEFRGQLPHPEAVAAARAATLFVLPSVDEAFGVAYVEAMGAGVPAIGCRGEDGPEEIAAAGGGVELVPPRDPRALAHTIDALLSNPDRRAALANAARQTVERAFTWERCGRETARAYERVASR